ncbi:hypothetical protein [Caballeronia sp. dw_19]|uniref:hypothetical protein n=1 Tax=Caballeronia sp. dw_19 TaxID=2719791 RepID=UPI001BD6C5A8|nr:hypothetical protein [Caballeronia sp. dw_19]
MERSAPAHCCSYTSCDRDADVTQSNKKPVLTTGFFIFYKNILLTKRFAFDGERPTQRLGAAFGDRHNRPGLLGHLLRRRGYAPVVNNERGSTRDFVVSDFSERTPGCD